MPRASDPPPLRLPARLRPLGVRVAATAMASALTVTVVTIWIAFPPEIRAQFTLFQEGTLLLIGAILFAAGFALARCRLDLDDQGLTVVNGYRTHRFEWSQVVAISLRPGNPWAVLDLSDGTSQPVMAIQGSDGPRAATHLRQVRRVVEAHSASEPEPRRPDSDPDPGAQPGPGAG